MSNAMLHPTIHLTPAERYFRGEISLEDATRAEVSKMREERRETRFGPLNVIIRVLVLIVVIPIMVARLLDPRRWWS